MTGGMRAKLTTYIVNKKARTTYNVKTMSYIVVVELLLLFLPLPPMLVLVLLASRNTLMRKCVISGAGGCLRPPTSTTSTSWTTGNAGQGKMCYFLTTNWLCQGD